LFLVRSGLDREVSLKFLPLTQLDVDVLLALPCIPPDVLVPRVWLLILPFVHALPAEVVGTLAFS